VEVIKLKEKIIFGIFYFQEKNYELLKQLPKLLEFYNLLHQRFKYRIEKKTAADISIGDFIKEIKTNSKKLDKGI